MRAPKSKPELGTGNFVTACLFDVTLTYINCNRFYFVIENTEVELDTGHLDVLVIVISEDDIVTCYGPILNEICEVACLVYFDSEDDVDVTIGIQIRLVCGCRILSDLEIELLKVVGLTQRLRYIVSVRGMIGIAIERQTVEGNSTVIQRGLILNESADSLNIFVCTGRHKAVVFFNVEFEGVSRNVSGRILNDFTVCSVVFCKCLIECEMHLAILVTA